MAGKYEHSVNLRVVNDSHTFLVWLTGRNKEVLDVGTATGFVAEALAKRGCKVTGIEAVPEAASRAKEHCERVLVGDIESMDLDELLEGEAFDVIIFGDVLEHLKEPSRTLERMLPFLKPEGYVVASIPNIAHGSVRLALLQGDFDYRPKGLLDNTHLRFYTRQSIEELFRDAGYALDVLERIRLGIFDTEVEVDRDSIPEEVLTMIRADPESETYQFVLSAYPYGSTPLLAKLTNRVQLLEDQLSQRDWTIQELGRKVRNHNTLQRQLADRERQLATKSREASKLAREVATRNQRLTKLRRANGRLRRQVERLGGTPPDETPDSTSKKAS